jgi:hypothetical protein
MKHNLSLFALMFALAGCSNSRPDGRLGNSQIMQAASRIKLEEVSRIELSGINFWEKLPNGELVKKPITLTEQLDLAEVIEALKDSAREASVYDEPTLDTGRGDYPETIMVFTGTTSPILIVEFTGDAALQEHGPKLHAVVEKFRK